MIIQSLTFRLLCIIFLYYLNINILTEVILLLLFDMIDCGLVLRILYGKEYLCKTYYYQLGDKLLDLFTYYLIYKILDLDYIYLYIILYRLLGIIFYTLSNNKIYFIIFADFFKEVLLYNFIFNKLNYNVIIIIILKIIFEYYWHFIKYQNNYK